MTRQRISAVTALAVLALIAGCSDSKAPKSGTPTSTPRPTAAGVAKAPTWPAPADPLRRAVAASLVPAVMEHLTFHVHAHLDVFVDGMPVTVPAGIGINIRDPRVMKFPEADGSTSYGGITRCAQLCISPLHTHDATGILHTESQVLKPNVLGEFFVEWGVQLSRSCIGEFCAPTSIAVYVNGRRYSADPRTIELTDQKEIAIVIGTPPASIPKTADFSMA